MAGKPPRAMRAWLAGNGRYTIGPTRFVTAEQKFKFQFAALARQRPMAPLCKGGCQKSLIFDWGIVVLLQPLRSKSKILTTSPYTGEARASRSILPDKPQFDIALQKEKRLCPCVKRQRRKNLCGTTLVPGCSRHSISRYRANPAQPTRGLSVRCSEVIRSASCLLPCTFRQLSGGGAANRASSSKHMI